MLHLYTFTSHQQNDYQDTYKHGVHENHAQYEDAKEGRLVWPLYIAIQHGNNEQRSIITVCMILLDSCT